MLLWEWACSFSELLRYHKTVQESPSQSLFVFVHWTVQTFCLFVWVLWHINFCRLINAKSIFIRTALFQAIQFSISTQFSFIWPINRTLLSATTPDSSGPGSNGNKGVLCIPQSSSITGPSRSDCLVSYLGHLLEESYFSAERQSVYSTAPADWAKYRRCLLPHKGTDKLYNYFNHTHKVSLFPFCTPSS